MWWISPLHWNPESFLVYIWNCCEIACTIQTWPDLIFISLISESLFHSFLLPNLSTFLCHKRLMFHNLLASFPRMQYQKRSLCHSLFTKKFIINKNSCICSVNTNSSESTLTLATFWKKLNVFVQTEGRECLLTTKRRKKVFLLYINHWLHNCFFFRSWSCVS